MNNKKRLLLLNPPIQDNKLFIRSGYCNSVSKAGYYWAPIDLLVQSGILKNHFELEILDATALRWKNDKTLSYLKNKYHSFDGLLFITSLASKDYDFSFIEVLKKELKIKKLLVSAGYLLFENYEALNLPFIDGVLLDYTSSETINFFNSQNDTFTFIATKKNIKTVKDIIKYQSNEFEYPVPLHLNFPLKKYYMPNCKSLPMTNIITNLGCPFNCDFCTWANLKYRQRKINNVLEELNYLNQNKIYEIMFIDPTFGANKKYSFELLNAIINNNIKISFSIECRVDLINDEFLKLLKKAGCHSITFGLESGNNEILKKINKNFTVEDIKNIFKLCYKYGILPTGHFIIGLPGETKETILNTINLAKEINCDFASFNIAMPLPGTKIFNKNEFTLSSYSDVDKPKIVYETKLTPDEILYYAHFAFKKFYFRPSYILKRLVYLFKHPVQFKIIVFEFLNLIKKIF